MLNLGRNGQKTLNKTLTLTLTLAALFLPVSGAMAGGFSAGPLYDRFPLTIGSGARTEILGPLYYDEQDDTKSTWAFPPFFSHETDPTIEQSEDDFLYPVLTYTKYGTQYRFEICEVIIIAGGENADSLERHRITLFPVYFQQRSPATNDNYTALFPIYGHLKDRLFRNRIFFVMFPAYSQTQKRDVINNNYLYPFFNTRHGDGMHGWQFWPFYGTEHKTLTTFTNTWGVETNGGHDQYFVLWPIHFRQNNGIGTDNPEKLSADLPFFAKFRSPKRDSTSVLWPFFNWIDDREKTDDNGHVKEYREWEMPWPIIEFTRGEGKTGTRIFPFYNHVYNDVFTDDFYAWPVYRYDSVHAPPLDRRRLRIFFFLFQDTADKNTETGKVKRRLDLWPLFVYHHNIDGSTRLQIIAPLETFFPDNRGIARNWSPLWSIWRSENNPATGVNSQSVLWNFYRRDALPNSKKISFFFGLYQYQSTPDTKKVRLFFIPVINRHPYHAS